MMKLHIVLDVQVEDEGTGEQLMREVMTTYPRITRTALHEPDLVGHQEPYEGMNPISSRPVGTKVAEFRRGHNFP